MSWKVQILENYDLHNIVCGYVFLRVCFLRSSKFISRLMHRLARSSWFGWIKKKKHMTFRSSMPMVGPPKPNRHNPGNTQRRHGITINNEPRRPWELLYASFVNNVRYYVSYGIAGSKWFLKKESSQLPLLKRHNCHHWNYDGTANYVEDVRLEVGRDSARHTNYSQIIDATFTSASSCISVGAFSFCRSQ
jgi:hypothetical protein